MCNEKSEVACVVKTVKRMKLTIKSIPPTSRNQLRLDTPRNRIIHSLPDRRPHPPIRLTQHHHLRDLKRGEITQPQLHKLPRLVQLIQLLQRLLKRQRPIRGMQVEYIHAVRPQLFQGGVELLLDLLPGMRFGEVGIPFCGDGEATFLPVGVAGEGFLFAADVDAGGVDFAVAGGLEFVEDGVVGVEGGDAGAGCFVGAAVITSLIGGIAKRELGEVQGHGAQDDPGLACAGDERHFDLGGVVEAAGE